jgi:hypothetical protein
MSDRYLRRYTDIAALIYLLNERKLSLLDPRSWDDSNDSHYLALYGRKNDLKSVLAVCFTQSGETYQHWRVFAPGTGGVCIRFKRSSLLELARKQPGVRIGAVNYLTLGSLKKMNPSAQELPFLKRFAFQNEKEFRIIYESKSLKLSKRDIVITLSCIDRVTLSPWIHPSLCAHLKVLLQSIDGCRNLRVVRSTLISNEDWKKFGEEAQ